MTHLSLNEHKFINVHTAIYVHTLYMYNASGQRSTLSRVYKLPNMASKSCHSKLTKNLDCHGKASATSRDLVALKPSNKIHVHF